MANVDSGAAPVVVLVEPDREGRPTLASLECLGVAIEIGKQMQCDVIALTSGDDAGAAAADVARYAVQAVRVLQVPPAEPLAPEVRAAAIAAGCAALAPAAVLLGESLAAADLAPRIAFALGVALVTDCANIRCDGGEMRLRKSVYGGNIVAEYAAETVPFVATMQSGCARTATKGETALAPVTPLAVTVAHDVSTTNVEVLERVCEALDGPALATAQVVVAGGRGVGDEGFRTIRDLASVLHGAVGASRPACDAGWAPARCQVGLTGQRVAPSLYVAAGISGASQHLAGMTRAQTIVAINKDARANVFRVADYGVVGCWEEVGPALCDAVAELRGVGKE
jgi:electron transfer flavoprotein alpha subunit